MSYLRDAAPAKHQRTRLVNDHLLSWPLVRVDDDLFPPGWVMAPHAHHFLQIIYVVSGRGIHHHEGSHSFGPGDILVIEPGAAHGWTNGRCGWLNLIDIGIIVDASAGFG